MNIEIPVFRIREDNINSKKKKSSLIMAKTNFMKNGQTFKTNKNKPGLSSGKGYKLRPKDKVFKKKYQGKYFKYDEVGHKYSKCRLPKKNDKKKANVI